MDPGRDHQFCYVGDTRKERNWQITDDLRTSQFERFTNKVKNLLYESNRVTVQSVIIKKISSAILERFLYSGFSHSVGVIAGCTRYVNMKPEFLYRKYTFIVWKWLKIFYSKYCPSLAIHFSHLSGNWWMPRQKKLSLFWGKPVIEPFSYIFVRSEVLVRNCMSHRCK